ncbi:MAG: hypothetical protein IBJ04_06345 [Hydrogenophaga sp.]|uniref:DUF6161 domain-containing protein n=1 Tax=Hydrogenophaga sp. TaxID=1904254 RepID=UPI002580A9C9|nr:DUF6161 domain-containing protein [Hydrogenophaga sp.]MBL0943932.1 hypothetical protein [Hydrogenophaga sp.]
MSEIVAPPPAKATPLFSLDLADNGGRLAPTDHGEFVQWIQREYDFWLWIQQQSFGSHDALQREASGKVSEALNYAHQSQQHIQSNPQYAQQLLELSCDRIQQAFLRLRLPHSSTPLAKRVDAYRKEAGEQAASYFLAVWLNPASSRGQIQATEFAAWRGVLEGFVDRFQLPQAAARRKRAAVEQSLDQLRAKTELLLGEKTEAYDALHRDYESLAESVRLAAAAQASEFEATQGQRQSDFDQLKVDHERAMEALRKTFREELALRAPAEYWKTKRNGHHKWAWVTGVVSFAAIAGAATGLGWQVHDLLVKTPSGHVPDTWRLAVLALIGVFTVWALRLVVRMFLSHLHLLTDAGERVVMVQTYLSLLEGDQLASKEDRQLILQALFRPATDGIVKDEGIPLSLAEALTRNGKS